MVYPNVVASKLTVANLNDCDDDVAFVLGRNIYQAACGSARDISSYIQNFRERTTGVNGKTRKALLDGMLFEIFLIAKVSYVITLKRLNLIVFSNSRSFLNLTNHLLLFRMSYLHIKIDFMQSLEK